MKQRINLYRPSKKSKRLQPLSLVGSVLIAGVSVTLVLAIGLALQLYAAAQNDQMAALQQQNTELTAEVTALETAYRQRKVHPEILAEQERIKSQIAARSNLQGLLHRLNAAESPQYSAYLYDLAIAAQKDSWLTAIVLNTAVKELHLSGEALSSAAVPKLLEEVVRTDSFRGAQFNTLNIETDDNSARFKAVAELHPYE